MRNYLLLTPGPLSTSETVREAMLQDWCTWDKDYNEGIVTPIRQGLLRLAGLDANEYTSVLLQGSGTYCVEATLGAAVGPTDLYAQWETMEKGSGKWRFTSPTHVVHAFYQAMKELDREGGIEARYQRYRENHRILVAGMRKLGFQTLLPDAAQGPIITSFLYPSADFDFGAFYAALQERGFVIYPGKISDADTFRIGNIGDIFPEDMERLLEAIQSIR